MSISGLKESKVFAVLLSALLVGVFSRASYRLLFDTPDNREIIKRSELLLERISRSGDVGRQLVVYNHGGQVGVSREFVTVDAFDLVLAEINKKIEISRARKNEREFVGCVGDMQVSVDYFLLDNEYGYVVQVVSDQSSVQPIGCERAR